VSPGIPMNAPVIIECRRQSVPVVSELEVGWIYTKGRIVAVTGSNGKSTTTALLAHIFKGTDRPTFCCGNIGLPLSAVADQTTDDSLLAVEVSSYQLATIDRFRPDVGILMNITPDHLQWHGGFDNYKQAKARLWCNQTPHDWMVYFADDPEVMSLIDSIKSHSTPFSIRRELSEGTFLDDNDVIVEIQSGRDYRFVNLKQLIHLPGEHNIANVLAAMTASLLIGVKPTTILQRIGTFTGLPHRLETVREIDGVKWINDSKATSVDAGIVALKTVNSHEPDHPTIILIAGGQPKGGGFRMIRDIVAGCVKRLVLIGEAADEIERDLGDLVPVEHACDMEDAVIRASRIAANGDIVLLSPLCASFDMYRDFEQRGDIFRRLVREID
ncbi:MAG: UDP-N-acetylmuramoyl-L-alanine--D-glutamate ligase, partial [Candidatus Electryoneaceae bacterium]|nr:UDP-N-acetylmuramoyl-L-alanine--D-glutamate ligase [Candidatus Electryoneaceae bacterium]